MHFFYFILKFHNCFENLNLQKNCFKNFCTSSTSFCSQHQTAPKWTCCIFIYFHIIQALQQHWTTLILLICCLYLSSSCKGVNSFGSFQWMIAKTFDWVYIVKLQCLGSIHIYSWLKSTVPCPVVLYRVFVPLHRLWY